MPPDPSAVPGVVITVQSYGDRLNHHPHIHALASKGVWSSGGSFEPIPALDGPQLMLLFRHHMLQNLLACGRIGQATLDILDRFHYPGFSAYEGEGVAAGDSAARERLASYAACFSYRQCHQSSPATEVQQGARQAPRLDACLAFCHRLYRLHTHPNVRDWLARHPRFHLHFTPTSSS